MELAIKEAKKSSELLKCGVVIVKNGKIISKSYNSQRASNDASAHAEINAIRKAGKKLKNKNLNECIIYCTCEPCIMCLSAITFAKIKKLVFGVSLRGASPKEKFIDISTGTFLSHIPYKIEVLKNFMEKECRELTH